MAVLFVYDTRKSVCSMIMWILRHVDSGESDTLYFHQQRNLYFLVFLLRIG